MIDLNSPEIQFALQTVRRATILVRQVQAEMVTPALTKEDHSPVTIADYASQAIVGFDLEKAFPAEPLVAEEDASVLRADETRTTLEHVAGFVRKLVDHATALDVCDWIDRGQSESALRFWTLDPIDGTKGFLRGDQYAVALALIQDGIVQIGVLGCPNLANAQEVSFKGEGLLVIGVRNQGAWTTSLDNPGHFEPIKVSPFSSTVHARLLRSFESGHTNTDQIEAFAATLGVKTAPLLMDSQAKYAVLAAGKGDLMLRMLSPARPNYREKIWDQSAGSIVLEEAGGKLTDLDGKALDFTTGRELVNNRGILASNGHLHSAALNAIREIGA